MLEPIESLGAVPRLYRITADLQADMDDFRRCAGPRVKAAIAVHFYGVISDLESLRDHCMSAGIALVEDCAHCFSYRSYAQPAGEFGDFVITSSRKFMPTWDGGELIFANHADEVVRRAWPDLTYNLKAIKNTIEFSSASARLGKEIFARFRSQPMPSEPKAAGAGDAQPPSHNHGSIPTDYEDPRFGFGKTAARTSLSSGLISRLLDLEEVIERRRRNFELLRQECDGLRNGRVLVPEMDRCETPYVFPLYVDRGDAVYSELRRVGVPMWRWDECRPSDCAVSVDYGRQVIQFPCHQGLTQSQVASIGALIRKVVG
jgi:dTDP-4-amino-4,6-dideoxygalactose transaminase